MFCSGAVKNAIGSLIGIALNLYIALGSAVIFTMLILPIQEHGISLHLFLLSLISFISDIVFCIEVFSPFGRFIPRYFILFVATVNESVSLISLSDFLLLVIGMQAISALICILLLYQIH